MGRTSGRRISKIEELHSAVLKKKGRLVPLKSFYARRHAVAVAAIVLSGQPKIDEPLHRAWARALQHYGVNVKWPGQWNDQVAAAQQLSPIIMGEEEVSARFTEIFRTAPVWLLQFTGMAMDARLQEFQLPDVSERLRWGSNGYEDAREWPRLPSGVMTAGYPIPDLDERRLWIILFCMVTVPIPDFPSNLYHEDKEVRFDLDNDPLIEDLVLALELDRKPEQEWSRYEKRRMRKLAERVSRL